MLFGKVFRFMLDLAYVRENLTQVEEMLRRRGMDPQSVLSGFRQVDEKRRQLITQSETLKAQRNRASEEIAKLKKAGQDATANIIKKLNEENLLKRDVCIFSQEQEERAPIKNLRLFARQS